MRLFRWMLVLATPAIAACSGVTEPPSGLPIDLTASVGAPYQAASRSRARVTASSPP